MLKISDLHAQVDELSILKGVNLEVPAGEVHAIMGPNGSGKSTLTKVMLGNEDYDVTAGEIQLDGESLHELDAEERARAGLFVGFQYPIEVPGVNNLNFLRMSFNAHAKARGQKELSAEEFTVLAQKYVRELGMDQMFLDRDLNSGFSGGQKKRNEILQMFVLQPKLAILDETDSGLDVDALRAVADGINAYRAANRSIVLITHYQRLLDLVTPDKVHIFAGGRIVKSGGFELATELEQNGYEGVMV